MTEQIESPQLNLQDLLEEDFSNRKPLELELKGRKITFELREPTMRQIAALRKNCLTMSQSGVDYNRSNFDKFAYGTVAMILYYNDAPAFPNGVKQATEFIDRLPVTIGNTIVAACRDICGDDNAESEVEELEKN